LQRKLKVAFLGPEYSFSHVAALMRFGQDVEFVGVATIAAIFEEVSRKQVDFGVVPIENSTDGRITDTLDSFVRFPIVKICSEVRLRVHHHLLANCEPSEIGHIYSKPQALSQCRNWLSKTLPRAQIHEIGSTAAAAQLVLNNPAGNAAIASREAAVRYGLRILFENIEDSPDNATRFAVVGTHDSDRTGNDCTALMIQIPHSPSSLANTLTILGQNKINLTWIESFPVRDAAGEYVFFVAMDGHKDDAKVKRALASLEEHCEQLTILGSFPVAPLSE
jgi:chorismate mutase/prephenate dehydratase